MTTLSPIFGPIFWLFRSRPAQASPLRSEASRALRSRAKKSEVNGTPSRRKKACQPAKNLRPMPRQPVLQSFNNLTEIKIPPKKKQRGRAQGSGISGRGVPSYGFVKYIPCQIGMWK